MKCKTHWAKIYIAGPIEVAKQFLRLKAKDVGMCVTIEPTTYIYSGGEEVGYVIGLINYPRFPKSPEAIRTFALDLAAELKDATGQMSYTIMFPDQTEFFSDKEEGSA